MISIRKYLYQKSRQPGAAEEPAAEGFQESLVQLASVSLSELAAQCDGEAAVEPVALSIGSFKQRLESAETPPEIDAIRTEIPVAFGEFRRIKQEQERRQTLEVQKMVQMLQQTIEALSRGNQRSMARLRTIEADIHSASQISEIVALKERLSSCVEQIRESARAEQREFAEAKTQLEQDFRAVQESVAMVRGGLPGRLQAERRIAEAAGSAVFVAVLLERHSAIKARYGAPAGERYFSAFLDELSARFPAPKNVFRWNEPILLLDLPASEFSGPAEPQVRERLAGLPRSARIDVGGRIAVLDNVHRWSIVSGPDPAETVRRIEEFASV